MAPTKSAMLPNKLKAHSELAVAAYIFKHFFNRLRKRPGLVALFATLFLLHKRYLTFPRRQLPYLLYKVVIAVLTVTKNNLIRGPKYPEWTYLFELVVTVVRCVGIHADPVYWAHPASRRIFEDFQFIAFTPIAKLSAWWYSLTLEEMKIMGVPCCILTPKHAPVFSVARDDDCYLLYVHGGGYVAMSPRSHTDLVARIMEKMNTKFKQSLLHPELDKPPNVISIVPDYSLAPHKPFPAGLEDIVTVYLYLLTEKRISPNRIVMAGDSAGGGLTIAVLLSLKRRGFPMPRAVGLLSPFVDMQCSAEDADGFCYITKNMVDSIASQYLPPSFQRKHSYPETSPVKADLSGLPPLLIQAGGIELLLPEIRKVVENAKRSQVQVRYEEYPNMPHVFQGFEAILPAASGPLESLATFFVTHINLIRPDKFPREGSGSQLLQPLPVNKIWRVASAGVF